VLNRVGVSVPMQAGRDRWWHALIDWQSDRARTEHTRAEDPLMISYTSGTTRHLKGALHTHCGFRRCAGYGAWTDRTTTKRLLAH
jgi:acetyl-CoA synthetase